MKNLFPGLKSTPPPSPSYTHIAQLEDGATWSVTGSYSLICSTSYELFSYSLGFIANLLVCLENSPDIQFRMAGLHAEFFTEAALTNISQVNTFSISSLDGTMAFIRIQATPKPPKVIPELSKRRYSLSLIIMPLALTVLM